jgi:hypothetical protein
MALRPSTRRAVAEERNLPCRPEEKVADQKWIFLYLLRCGRTSVAASLRRVLGAGPEGFINPVQTREWAETGSFRCRLGRRNRKSSVLC